MIKVLMVGSNVKEFQDHLNDGWVLRNAMAHPKGLVIVIEKP